MKFLSEFYNITGDKILSLEKIIPAEYDLKAKWITPDMTVEGL
jgi:hypothetical protein